MKRLSRPFHNLLSRLPFGEKKGQSTAERRRRRRVLRDSTQTASPFPVIAWPRVALTLATMALLSFLLCIHLLPGRIPWGVGETAQWEVVAPRTVRYEDTAATKRMREDAAQQVEDRYDLIPGARTAAQDAISAIFSNLDETLRESAAAAKAGQAAATTPASDGENRTPDQPSTKSAALPSASETPGSLSTLNPAEILRADATVTAARIRRELGQAPPVDDLARLLQQREEVRQTARGIAERIVARAMARPITEDKGDLQTARDALYREETLKALPTRELRESVAAVAGAALLPNRRKDTEATERERAAARASIPPQIRRLPAGTVIIRPGEIVTQQHLDQFAPLGLSSSRFNTETVVVLSLLVCLMITLATVYIRQFHPDIYQDTRQLLLLCILTVLSVLGLKVGSALLGFSSVPGVHFAYLGMMCVASAGMVIALTISPRVAMLIVALLSVASGIALNNELRFTVISLCSSLVGIICVSALKNRGDLLRATLYVCAANALLNLTVGYLENDQPGEIWMGALWGVVSGVFALALFYFGVAAFEKPFGITTHLRLLELSDPATPILQEFRMRVPGTYAHSLMVSNIAHAAAEAIGANALLVRVAAYYHDLGKMNRPEFFIENQSNAENIHDRIAPSLSAIILASHVKEGVEIAEELGLPPRVRELIQQHHGTTLMKYFYHRATGGLPNPTLEAQFRYAGPKPQSKEAAILMIADSVEAASRSLVRPTPTRISDFVARIIEDKRADGQLDECDLTLHDLKVIHEVIARTLSGALHARVDYPGDRSGGRPAERTGAPAASAPAPVTPLAPAALRSSDTLVPADSLSEDTLTLPCLPTGAPITEDGDCTATATGPVAATVGDSGSGSL